MAYIIEMQKELKGLIDNAYTALENLLIADLTYVQSRMRRNKLTICSKRFYGDYLEDEKRETVRTETYVLKKGGREDAVTSFITRRDGSAIPTREIKSMSIEQFVRENDCKPMFFDTCNRLQRYADKSGIELPSPYSR
jgi:hypothetical protein